MQNWARVLAMIFCIIGILHHGGQVYLQLVLVNPVLDRDFGRVPWHSEFTKFVGMVGIVELIAGAGYFLVQVVVLPLTSPGVSMPDYEDRPPPRGRRWDTDDVYEDERPRRRRRIEGREDDDYDEDDRPPRRRR